MRVQERIPDTSVSTGASCKRTAKTEWTTAKAWMIPATARLGPQGVSHNDVNKFAFAANEVNHQVQVDMGLRVYYGARVFGKCKRVGRQTCKNLYGTSKGKNKLPPSCITFLKNHEIR